MTPIFHANSHFMPLFMFLPKDHNIPLFPTYPNPLSDNMRLPSNVCWTLDIFPIARYLTSLLLCCV